MLCDNCPWAEKCETRKDGCYLPQEAQDRLKEDPTPSPVK